MILKMAKIRNVTIQHPISTKQAVLVTPSANNFSFSSISGIGLGVGVVGGGTLKKVKIIELLSCIKIMQVIPPFPNHLKGCPMSIYTCPMSRIRNIVPVNHDCL